PRSGRGGRRARASFVDESLFGSPAGARPQPPAFPPPWATAAGPGDGGGGGGPRPRSKCRLRSHTPSFCDESLFGAKRAGPARAAPWLSKEDVAKLHPLLWSPPPAPRPRPAPRCRDAPLRAVHPPAPVAPAPAGSPASREDSSCLWKRPDSCSGGRDAPGRGRSQSLSRLNAPSGGLCLTSDCPKTEMCKTQRPLTAPATPQGALIRGRSRSTSRPLGGSNSAVSKPRPPWK
ncbi:RITA1 protein, partial [Eubucco bourcierii]|nr:RITA1 protein [Eubucco bourcierii]